MWLMIAHAAITAVKTCRGYGFESMVLNLFSQAAIHKKPLKINIFKGLLIFKGLVYRDIRF